MFYPCMSVCLPACLFYPCMSLSLSIYLFKNSSFPLSQAELRYTVGSLIKVLPSVYLSWGFMTGWTELGMGMGMRGG